MGNFSGSMGSSETDPQLQGRHHSTKPNGWFWHLNTRVWIDFFFFPAWVYNRYNANCNSFSINNYINVYYAYVIINMTFIPSTCMYFDELTVSQFISFTAYIYKIYISLMLFFSLLPTHTAQWLNLCFPNNAPFRITFPDLITHLTWCAGIVLNRCFFFCYRCLASYFFTVFKLWFVPTYLSVCVCVGGGLGVRLEFFCCCLFVFVRFLSHRMTTRNNQAVYILCMYVISWLKLVAIFIPFHPVQIFFVF